LTKTRCSLSPAPSAPQRRLIQNTYPFLTLFLFHGRLYRTCTFFLALVLVFSFRPPPVPNSLGCAPATLPPPKISVKSFFPPPFPAVLADFMNTSFKLGRRQHMVSGKSCAPDSFFFPLEIPRARWNAQLPSSSVKPRPPDAPT